MIDQLLALWTDYVWPLVLGHDPVVLKTAAGVFLGGLALAAIRFAWTACFWVLWGVFAIIGAASS